VLSHNLPALQVVIPLLAAPLCVIVNRGRAAWMLATVASFAAFVIAAALLAQTLNEGVISYAMGGWAPPWGIEYRVDTVNAFVLLIVSAMSTLVLPFAHDSVRHEIEEGKTHLFYSGWLLCLSGLLGITITGDAFNIFVFLEISSLATYMLIALGKDRQALVAAFRYLILGTIGATFILIGVGLLYSLTGSLNLNDLAEQMPQIRHTRTVSAAFAFLVVGIGIKMALFPLHMWLPNAYTYAPSAVSALLAGTATKVAVYVLLRFLFTVFGAEYSMQTMNLDLLLLVLGLAAVFAASLTAIFQVDIKRMLAYSSVAQIGYITLGIAMVTVTGLTAAILHLFNHALIKTALFLAMGCVFYRVGSVSIGAMNGIAQRMPLTMAAFVAAGLSLIGVPLTVGFISKWYLISAALERDWWWLAVALLASSLLAVIYIWKVVEAAYFREPDETTARASEAPVALLLPTWVLVAANFYFGIHTTLTTGVAGHAAGRLLGVAP
jgi:multicomponent Na+:H+ antiporter subunit D